MNAFRLTNPRSHLAIFILFGLGAGLLPGAVQSSVLIARGRLLTKRFRVLIRMTLFIISLTFWVFIIKSEILNNFGGGFFTMATIFLFGVIYSAIIYALKTTMFAHM